MDTQTISIKTFAKKAKHRLISGYWDKIRQEREAYIKNNSNESEQKIKDLYARRLMRDIYCDAQNEKDNELYRKVCKMLNQNAFAFNPISQLIDHKEYDNMDIEARQNYIIKLTDKYNEMRERYERERQMKMCHSI